MNIDVWEHLLAPADNLRPLSIKKQSANLLEDSKNKKAIHFLVVVEGEAVGNTSIFNISRGRFQSAMIDIHILRKTQNESLEAAVLKLVEDFAFGELNLLKICTLLSPNMGRAAFWEKNGYHYSHADNFALFSHTGTPIARNVFIKVSHKVKIS